MIERRPFEKLGKSDHGWLKANFHFSFADYRNKDRVHWGALRVWNNDRIAPQSGFPPHPHRDMEIVTYVIKGAITHKDHLGNQGRTEAGQIARLQLRAQEPPRRVAIEVPRRELLYCGMAVQFRPLRVVGDQHFGRPQPLELVGEILPLRFHDREAARRK